MMVSKLRKFYFFRVFSGAVATALISTYFDYFEFCFRTLSFWVAMFGVASSVFGSRDCFFYNICCLSEISDCILYKSEQNRSAIHASSVHTIVDHADLGLYFTERAKPNLPVTDSLAQN